MKDFFFFRGNRHYIHVADILVAVISHFQIQPVHGFDYQVLRPALTCFTFAPYSDEARSQAFAHYKDNLHNILVLPTAEPVSVRIPDSEEEIRVGMSIHEGTASIDQASTEGSPYRDTVVVFKALLESINHDQEIKYKFVRLLLKEALPERFAVTYTRMIGGSFFEGILTADDVELGKIYFGRG